LGKKGRQAVEVLFKKAQQQNIFPTNSLPVFYDD